MKVVIQRVSCARVVVDEAEVAAIGPGILAFVGVEKGDTEQAASWLAEKIVSLRIFNDAAGKMNLSLQEISGSLLVVSQFTIAGSCDKGRRPSFDRAAPPDEGKRLYEFFADAARGAGADVRTGIFQADMRVELANDGPVTFCLQR